MQMNHSLDILARSLVCAMKIALRCHCEALSTRLTFDACETLPISGKPRWARVSRVFDIDS
jgi:hypothetical protein